MLARLKTLPFLLILMGIGTAAMMVPAIHAYQLRDLHVARSFFYTGLLFGIFFLMLAVAVGLHGGASRVRGQLLALAMALVFLPLMLAVPFHQALSEASMGEAWFEMVSSLTTTGATLYSGPVELPLTLHLWRAMVAWLGGLLFWVSALAILAPLNLGGFEVIATDMTAAGRSALRQRRAGQAGERLRRYAARLAPIYGGLTLLLWLLLSISGLQPTESAVLAMSTMSTSGITPGPWQPPGLLPEVFMFGFLILAVSRLTFRNDFVTRDRGSILRDPEIRLGAAICLAVPLFLVLRHWLGAIESTEQENLQAGLVAFWGGLFTTLSFLTTNGTESVAFVQARIWSGLETPGLILVGLSLVGGGVATTAGGVKLLRIYALYKHGTREMSRLVYPDSVGGSGSAGRRLRREGAFVAWIFFMLFAISIAVVMAGLTLAGQEFEAAMILSVAALSTTGPLAAAAGEVPIIYGELSQAARAIVAAAMVLGRLETLALIALLSRDFWR